MSIPGEHEAYVPQNTSVVETLDLSTSFRLHWSNYSWIIPMQKANYRCTPSPTTCPTIIVSMGLNSNWDSSPSSPSSPSSSNVVG
ncbi:hypothetical protein D9758_008792 [Tetrapyrgos nigripes]|uniref:Uncharacterized protein n=1 Tax=Tetrapyrgos nigripes TaxID=182062 RepID=A0A8H5FX70_9AGAR|nr:hypothetical protein D9758_008792 [Tetrapyrgos nigripes]